jgi:hypothetical protein
MIYIVSTRFTNKTWEQNREYRSKNGYNCIYGSPQEMSPKILVDSIVFVVEMNNDKNEIEGIGLIRNRPILDKYYKIYDDCNYNRYTYKSNYRLDRETILRVNPTIVDVLDNILFKGNTHLKRGSGFTSISEKLLKKASEKNENIKLIEEIRNIFIFSFKI